METQYTKATLSNAGMEKLEAGRVSAWERENERLAKQIANQMEYFAEADKEQAK